MIKKMIVAVALTGATTSACADECDVMLSRVVTATGAHFERATSSYRHMKHRLAGDLSLRCQGDAIQYDIFIAWRDAFPPDPFFDLAAVAGSTVTGDTAANAKRAVLACHRKALSQISATTTDGMVDEIVRGKTAVECQVFKRDGGGANFTIYRPEKD